MVRITRWDAPLLIRVCNGLELQGRFPYRVWKNIMPSHRHSKLNSEPTWLEKLVHKQRRRHHRRKHRRRNYWKLVLPTLAIVLFVLTAGATLKIFFLSWAVILHSWPDKKGSPLVMKIFILISLKEISFTYAPIEQYKKREEIYRGCR